jgi:nicotinamide mononucleotide (NMN) deamidase PncC
MGAHYLTGPIAPSGIGGARPLGQAYEGGAKRQKVTTVHRLQDGGSRRLRQWQMALAAQKLNRFRK